MGGKKKKKSKKPAVGKPAAGSNNKGAKNAPQNKKNNSQNQNKNRQNFNREAELRRKQKEEEAKREAEKAAEQKAAEAEKPEVPEQPEEPEIVEALIKNEVKEAQKTDFADKQDESEAAVTEIVEVAVSESPKEETVITDEKKELEAKEAELAEKQKELETAGLEIIEKLKAEAEKIEAEEAARQKELEEKEAELLEKQKRLEAKEAAFRKKQKAERLKEKNAGAAKKNDGKPNGRNADSRKSNQTKKSSDMPPEKKTPKNFKEAFDEFRKNYNVGKIAIALGLVLAVIISANVLVFSLFSRNYKVPDFIKDAQFKGRMEPDSIAFDIDISESQQKSLAETTKIKGDKNAFKFYINNEIVMNEYDDPALIEFGSVESNKCVLMFFITDEDGNELYHSLGVEPGKQIRSISFFDEIPYGTHTVTVSVLGYNAETFKKVGMQTTQVKLKIGVG